MRSETRSIMRKHLLDCVWLWQIYTAALELQWREAEKLLTEAENRNTVSALNHTEIKILWLLANVLVGERSWPSNAAHWENNCLSPNPPKRPSLTQRPRKRKKYTHPPTRTHACLHLWKETLGKKAHWGNMRGATRCAVKGRCTVRVVM